MKAVICTKYGPPEVLRMAELDKPVPGNHEILIKVKATPVNTADTRIRGLVVSGIMRPVMRLILGISKPRNAVLGTIYAGVVEQVGDRVTRFKVGDQVYGTSGLKMGANAEYIAVSEKSVVTGMPARATFTEAATLPFGGQTAIYFLKKAGIETKSAPAVLIYGATGSVGTAAVQIAKYYQGYVTAVCSSKGEKLSRDLGADEIILYDKEDFAGKGKTYDIIFDAVGKIRKKDCSSLLNKGGKFVTVDSMDVASESTDQLEFLNQLFEKGMYQAIIDQVFPLEEVVEAHRYVDSGRKKGNVVLEVI